jgi:hypothetical protein
MGLLMPLFSGEILWLKFIPSLHLIKSYI